MAHQVFELDVRLREIEPPIWRTVEMPGSATLEDVHLAIQLAMGWSNSHLHHFQIGKTYYGMAAALAEGGPKELDERRYQLQDVARQGAKFLYRYDFGDDWEHEVVVKQVTTAAKAPRPRCTAGARACPPEDCGGPGGYARLLSVLADPRHPEHEEMSDWAEGFRPEAFKLPKTGRDLSRDIEELRGLAADDDAIADDAEDALDALDQVPRALVEAVLALSPMQRAAVIAVIAGSLAEDVADASSLLEQAAQHLQRAQPPPPRRQRSKSRQ